MNSNFEAFNNFKGLGDPTKGIWFIGLEEGGNAISETEIDQRVQECKVFPFYVSPCEVRKTITPVWDFISKFLTEFYCLNKVDWRLCRDRMLSNENSESDYDDPRLLDQNICFAKAFITELFPLPKKKYKDWATEYGHLFGLTKSDRKKYVEYVRLNRFPMIFDFWSETKPFLTICFGKSGWNYFKEMFHLSNDIPLSFNKILYYKSKNIILSPFFGNGQMSDNTITEIAKFSLKCLLDRKKVEVLNYVKSFDPIVKYFKLEFLEKIISEYDVIDGSKFSPNNFILANLLMSHQLTYNEKINFVTELSKMLVFFNEKYPFVINSSDSMGRLKDRNNANFQGKWSELSYVYYLVSKGINVPEINPKDKKNNEITDIFTERGSIEITYFISEALVLNESTPIFYSFDHFSDELIRIINKKIERKESQNRSDYIAIDCSRVDEMRLNVTIDSFIRKINFDVFKINKGLILLMRDVETEQIVFEKVIKKRSI